MNFFRMFLVFCIFVLKIENASIGAETNNLVWSSKEENIQRKLTVLMEKQSQDSQLKYWDLPDNNPTRKFVSLEKYVTKEYEYLWNDENKKVASDFMNIREIKMRRTACYGDCPIYVITFSMDGQASYYGIEFVNNTGLYTGAISSKDYTKLSFFLSKYIQEYSDNDFQSPSTDLPSCIITIKDSDGKEFEIYDYGEYGPIDLWVIQQSIDGLRDKINWRKVNEKSQKEKEKEKGTGEKGAGHSEVTGQN